MTTGLKALFSAATIILLLSSPAAGRGRGEFGGGEREFSDRGGEGEYRGGERGFSDRNREDEFRGREGEFPGRGGEGEYRNGGQGGFRGEGGTNRFPDNRSPFSNPSRPNVYDRPYPSFNPGEGSHTGPAPGPVPHPGRDPGFGPNPGLHPAPNPTPGPGPNPGRHPGPGPNPGPPHPAPNPTPGPHPGPGPNPNPWPHPGPHPNPGPHPGPRPNPNPWPHPGPGPNPNPGPGPGPNPNWYHGNWPNNWNNGWSNGPAAWGAGFATGVAAATPWAWGYWPQCNPYCPAPIVVGDTTVDYSQPIVLAAPPVTVVQSASQSAGAPAGAGQPTPTDQAMALLDAARAAFTSGDYGGALAKCDQAVARLPNSAAAHEFRGLALFALQRYKEAAGPVYAVLSVGPGWDWATLSSFYPSPDVYAGQLRALEQYVASNPNVAEARFLLAYHYMIGGHNDAAAEQFKAAVQLNPQDQLSAQLRTRMAPTAVGQPPAPSPAAAPAKPVDASAVAGVWTSTRADGTTITLSLSPDAKYTWKFAQKDKPQEFSGDYAVADNLLILKEGNNPMMVGQVTLLSGNRFNFKLAGDNPNDPGLTFGK